MNKTRVSITGQLVALLLSALVVTSCYTDASAVDDRALFPDGWMFSEREEAVTASNGMVVSTDEMASRIGVDIMRSGGNAVDAAVAVHFALAVVNPEAGNIGGGGFMVTRMADGTSAALDFREKAPLAATRDMYLDEEGNLTDKSVIGHLAAGVPGSVAGMWEAHQRFGSIDWEDLVYPAVELANGFEVKERFLGSLSSTMVES